MFIYFSHWFPYFVSSRIKMSDKSDLKAELERKKQRLAQIREEKKRKEEERKKKEVNMQSACSFLQNGLAECCILQDICHGE